MPTVAILGHVHIRMFANDHNPPHFHVVTANHQISIRLNDLSVMVGSMDRGSLSLALAWAVANRKVLEDEWHRLNER